MWESSAIGLKQIVNVALAAIAGALGVLVIGEARETFPAHAPSPSVSATATPRPTSDDVRTAAPTAQPRDDRRGKGHDGKGGD